LKKTSVALVDPTGTIDAIFSEEWSDSVKEGETYIFTNLRVKEDYYTEEKLNSKYCLEWFRS